MTVAHLLDTPAWKQAYRMQVMYGPVRENGGFTLMTNQIMRQGKMGLFGMIERSCNLRNSRMFVALSALLFAISVLLRFTVPEIAMIPCFMWLSAGILLASVVELLIVRQKDGVGNHLKWVIGVSFVVSAAITTSTLGAPGAIIFIFPLLLSIPYCSVLYSIFISVVTVMGAFIPLLLSAFLSHYDLNVIRLAPGTVIEVTSTLEAALGTVDINEAGTKVNELLSKFLPMVMLVIISAVVTVSITSAVRQMLLEQYRQFQTTRE